MAGRAIVPGALAAIVALVVGSIVGGLGVGVSAALGVIVAVSNFAVNAYALGWARKQSPTAVQVVALGGYIVRIGIVVGLIFLLRLFPWFDTMAFGIAVISAAILLLIYETKLVLGGLGAELEIPARPAPDSAEPAAQAGRGGGPGR